MAAGVADDERSDDKGFVEFQKLMARILTTRWRSGKIKRVGEMVF